MISIFDIFNAWDHFFFSLELPATFAVLRIFIGVLLLCEALVCLSNIKLLLGPEGIIPHEQYQVLYRKLYFNLFNYLPPKMGSVYLVYILFLVSSLFFLLGFFTLISNIIVFITLNSIQKRSILLTNGGDVYLRLFCFFMIFVPSGNMYSLDAILFDISAEPVSVWGMRLIQIMVSMVYINNIYWKSKGKLWRNGTATFFAMNGDFKRFPVPKCLFKRPFFRFLTYSTLLIEGTIPFLFWIEELRYPAILAGVLLHIGIEVFMNVRLLSYVSMIGLLTFVRPDHVQYFIDSFIKPLL